MRGFDECTRTRARVSAEKGGKGTMGGKGGYVAKDDGEEIIFLTLKVALWLLRFGTDRRVGVIGFRNRVASQKLKFVGFKKKEMPCECPGLTIGKKGLTPLLDFAFEKNILLRART